jgi:ADP-ribosylglycohydrolase
MPYYRDVTELAEQVSLWADLRHEQRANLDPILRRARSELKRAIRDLDRLPEGKDSEKFEPNGLAEIRSLRPRGPRRLWERLPSRGIRERLLGAWLGRAAGCTLGVPVESWSVEDMAALAQVGGQAFPPSDYWSAYPQPERVHYGACVLGDYLKGRIRSVPVDDDLGYTQLGLLILERYGPSFTTSDVAEAWKKHLPIACTAEEVALRNLKSGVGAKKAGARGNPYQEWIGADIRSDPWGYVAMGWPEKAAELAYRDAYLSHRKNGIYGAMFFAATIAAAFAVDDPAETCRIGLTEIPKDCRLARDLRWALRRAPALTSWEQARALVAKRFDGMHHVHTNNNACLTVFGLALGGGDFTKTIGYTVAMGFDNDCTAATAGSILGAMLGKEGIPAHWWRPFRNRALTYLKHCPPMKNTEIARRFHAQAIRLWVECSD